MSILGFLVALAVTLAAFGWYIRWTDRRDWEAAHRETVRDWEKAKRDFDAAAREWDRPR